jgi:NAD(P)-dependent dehydrogenase (short-subunit alcohol dehydrogenase family)
MCRTWLIVGATTAGLALALSAHHGGVTVIAATAPQQAAAATASDFKIPSGYRDWRLISVAILGAPFNDIRAKLGNDLAIRTFRETKVPFPDGAMIARLAWKQIQSEVNNNAFRKDPTAEHLSPAALQKMLDTSFAAGPPTNVQFMIKDSKKYASTGGWGFFQFTNGRRDHVVQSSCFACHAPERATDFVFTRYSP